MIDGIKSGGSNDQKEKDFLSTEANTLEPLKSPTTTLTFVPGLTEIDGTNLMLDHESFPVLRSFSNNLSLNNDFEDLSYIATGSNSYVYTARLKSLKNKDKVVIKMLREDVINDPIANDEFDKESSILRCLDHPNVVKVLGSGNEPYKFIVLEYLSFGSLEAAQANAKKSLGFFQKRLFNQPVFLFEDIIKRANEIASAMNYLHNQVHPNIIIVHRDLKHDNIGFASDGTLKVFDFGLSTCVTRSSIPDDLYMMTGGTGTMRYMAPEVALRQLYSEKVDVYSFSIVVWQMAKGKTFKKQARRAEFIRDVALNGERPPLDKSWPKEFSELLQCCWDTDPTKRPSFSEVIIILERISRSLSSCRPLSSKLVKDIDKRDANSSLNTARTVDSEADELLSSVQMDSFILRKLASK